MHQVSMADSSIDSGGGVISKTLLAEIAGDSTLITEAYYLNLILKMGLVATNDSSPLFIWANRCVCGNLFVVGLGTLVYVPITSLVTEEHSGGFVTMAGRLLFCVYTSIMYITYLD